MIKNWNVWNFLYQEHERNAIVCYVRVVAPWNFYRKRVSEFLIEVNLTKIVMNPDEKETIEAPTKGKQVTTTEYNEIIKKKMEEMREMYRGRRGGGKGFRK